jgi:uncharacterized membrane protein
MMNSSAGTRRLQYLDWLRGLAAVIMLQGHVFDAFTRSDLRQGGPFVFSQFVGGMPPAIFLFLTGVTLAFLMDSTERKGLGAGARVMAAFRRSGYLFLVAFLFRIQLWAFSQPAPWTDLFRVDILNCMGFSIALMSVTAVVRPSDRAKVCALLGLAIAFCAPLVSQMDWSGVPWILRNYIVPDYTTFGLFPWGAYLAFGIAAGSLIRTIPQEGIDRAMQWAALAGGALTIACHYFANLPLSLYTKSEYWLNSPALILTKLGITLVMLAFAFLWTRYGAGEGWSWVRQLGTTSLLVYWVHIELVYGRGFSAYKTNLSVAETVLAAACAIVAMLAISVVQTNRARIRSWFGDLVWSLTAKPGRASGD